MRFMLHGSYKLFGVLLLALVLRESLGRCRSVYSLFVLRGFVLVQGILGVNGSYRCTIFCI